jgi:beta-lactamase regulating signal transducer with metallopeptidase domain
LTVLAGLLLLLTRRSTAALRYAVLCTLFFLFLAGVWLTFLLEWNQGMEATEQTYAIAGQEGSFSFLSLHQWRTDLASFLNQNAHRIVLAWTLVSLFHAGRMVREVVYIRKLQNRRTRTAEPFWKARMQALAAELGIRKTVSLVESTVVKVPIVIGHFKPLVMVPLGMLNHLPPDEMEAVLLHEMAHIRRHDYLVNYLQRIAESLFFFNPGLLWVSTLLRVEREVCCDEMAIARTGNKRQFVEALIRCKEHAMQTPGFSLGLFGNRNLLLQRLDRIVSNQNKTLSQMEAALFGFSLLVLTLIFSGLNEPAKPAAMLASNHPVRQVVTQMLAQQPQKESKQVTTNNKPAPTVSLSRRLTQMKKQSKRKGAFENINKEQRRHDLNSDPQQQIVVQLNNRRATNSDVRRMEAEERRVQADLDRMQAEKAQHQAQIDRAEAELHRQEAARSREIANQYREKAQKDRLRAEKDRVEVQELREQANRRWQSEIVQ